MNYISKVPDNIDRSPIAYDMHVEYCLGKGYNPIHYVQCIGRCSECSKDDLYRVCPGCGAGLGGFAEMYKCSCETVMWICHDASGPLVTRYATPNKIFMTEEDII